MKSSIRPASKKKQKLIEIQWKSDKNKKTFAPFSPISRPTFRKTTLILQMWCLNSLHMKLTVTQVIKKKNS